MIFLELYVFISFFPLSHSLMLDWCFFFFGWPLLLFFFNFISATMLHLYIKCVCVCLLINQKKRKKNFGSTWAMVFFRFFFWKFFCFPLNFKWNKIVTYSPRHVCVCIKHGTWWSNGSNGSNKQKKSQDLNLIWFWMNEWKRKPDF